MKMQLLYYRARNFLINKKSPVLLVTRRMIIEPAQRAILSEQFEYTFFGLNFLHPKGGYFYGESNKKRKEVALPGLLALRIQGRREGPQVQILHSRDKERGRAARGCVGIRSVKSRAGSDRPRCNRPVHHH